MKQIWEFPIETLAIAKRKQTLLVRAALPFCLRTTAGAGEARGDATWLELRRLPQILLVLVRRTIN